MTESAEAPKKPVWLVPDYPPLANDLVGKAAVNGQIVNYPQIVRSKQDDPIPNQSMSCMSFMLFKEPRKMRNGKYAYGFIKNRGNWAGEDQALRHATRVVKEQDSKFRVLLAPVGSWMPITDAIQVADEQIDVREKDEEIHLRDEAQREKDRERRRIMREIREREEELKKGDIYDDPESLTYYSMRRVTEVKLREAAENQARQIEATRENIVKVQKELKKLERIHPEYIDQWIDRYNVERRKAGIPDYTPSDTQLEEYAQDIEALVLTSSEDENDDDLELTDDKGKEEEI